MKERREFNGGVWQKKIDVRNFIQKNYTLYEGDSSFLAPPTARTKAVWDKCLALLAEERKKGGVLDVETGRISGICNFEPGYIDRENEVIVGLQTDAPLKRMVNLYDDFYGDNALFLATMLTQETRYNALMDELDALEEAGRVFVLRPAQPIGIGRFEGDTEKLLDLYNRGRREMRERLAGLRAYLEA